MDRQHHDKAIAALRGVASEIRQRQLTLYVAPEGTRSRDGTMHAFKKGAFHLAQESGAPIYPVVIAGAYDLWPRHRLLPKPGKVRIAFLPPVDTSSWRKETLDVEVAKVREAMLAMHSRLSR